MARYPGLVDADGGDDLIDRLLAALEGGDDASPRWVREGLEHVVMRHGAYACSCIF